MIGILGCSVVTGMHGRAPVLHKQVGGLDGPLVVHVLQVTGALPLGTWRMCRPHLNHPLQILHARKARLCTIYFDPRVPFASLVPRFPHLLSHTPRRSSGPESQT